jgi:TolB-like protein/Tfp pilus assembly protein PilF
MAPMASADHSLLRIADLRVSPALDEIYKDGRTIKLEPKAMQLLVCLAQHAGEVLSVDQLLDLVWKDVVVSQDSVYAAVAALRRTLGDDPKTPTYIANVVRRGYRLIAPVSPWVDSQGEPAIDAATATPEKPSIAVMPFANLSGDPAQEYFTDGITADIISELSRWRRLDVRSRSASFRYRGIAVDTRQVARELDVRFVVEGSIRRLGERVRISVQLIEAATGSHIWSERFDRELNEIFEVQDRVVQTIVSTLVGRVQISVNERSGRKPPASLAAYECVLKCNALAWDEPTGEAEAVRLVEKAIELDPGYAFAYALLAALRLQQWYEAAGSLDSLLEEAYVLATRAVSLGDGESTCHAMLGHACIGRRAYELAEHHGQRAVELNPNNQWNAADLGAILLHVGKSEEALTWLDRARQIDPYFDEPWYWRAIGLACMTLHRYADALSSLNQLRVRTYHCAAITAGCHAELGDSVRASASVAECLALRPNFSVAQFVNKRPFKIVSTAAALAASLRLAGLPE